MCYYLNVQFQGQRVKQSSLRFVFKGLVNCHSIRCYEETIEEDDN